MKRAVGNEFADTALQSLRFGRYVVTLTPRGSMYLIFAPAIVVKMPQHPLGSGLIRQIVGRFAPGKNLKSLRFVT